MKKLLALVLALCAAISLCACGSTSTPAATTAAPAGDAAPAATEAPATEAKKDVKELKWGSVHPETQVVTQMMMKAIDEINANAEGIHVTGYPNGVLGGSSDLVEGVQEGMVDIITEGPAQFASWIPKVAQVEAPYLWQSVEHI